MVNEICFMIHDLSGGGAENVVNRLSSTYAQRGYKVSIILVNSGECAYNIHPNVKVLTLPQGVQCKNTIHRVLLKVRYLRKYLNEHSGCTVISFLYKSHVYALLGTKFQNNRWIASERNDPQRQPAQKYRNIIRNLTFCFADKCVFQTEMARDYFPKAVRKKSVIIPNPIENISQKRIRNEKHIIINACRLAPQKNLTMLINAFKTIHTEFPNYVLKIYGVGPEYEKLKNKIKDEDLENSAFLEGFCEDISSAYREAEIYVSTSDFEGISNSMIEAMNIGLPVICTDCPAGGAKMMITHNKNGILIPVNGERELINSLKMLIKNPEFAEQLAQNAIDRCKQFSIDAIADEWEKVF